MHSIAVEVVPPEKFEEPVLQYTALISRFMTALAYIAPDFTKRAQTRGPSRLLVSSRWSPKQNKGQQMDPQNQENRVPPGDRCKPSSYDAKHLEGPTPPGMLFSGFTDFCISLAVCISLFFSTAQGTSGLSDRVGRTLSSPQGPFWTYPKAQGTLPTAAWERLGKARQDMEETASELLLTQYDSY